MTYSNHFVLCVLVDNKPQKERKDGIVLIPYEKEYSLRFRNKNNRRAMVKFTIDGEEVSGAGYIIPAFSAIDIHRHFNKDARFKFVSLDSPDAIDHGKTGNEDGSKGVIEARFYLEQTSTPVVEHHYHYHYEKSKPHPLPWNKPNPWEMILRSKNVFSSEGQECIDKINLSCSSETVSATNKVNTSFNDGCTVEGSASGQNFAFDCFVPESNFVALRLVLKGIDKIVETQEINNVEYCTNCGAKKSRKIDRFCGSCGHKF